MRFIPDYRVCYKGTFYDCDEGFDIDPADAEEMSEHGEIMEESASFAEPDTPKPEEITEEKPKRGRRRKNDEPREDETQNKRGG